MKTLLFIIESYTTAIRLIPVYLEAKKDSKYNVIMFSSYGGDQSMKKLFMQYNIKSYTYQDILTNGYISTIETCKNNYEKIYLNEINKYGDNDFNYKGVPILPLLGVSLLNWNKDKLFFMMVFDKIIEKFAPDVVIVAYDSGGSKKYYVNRARQKGIKTLNVQYGHFATTAEKKKENSQYFCIWGEGHKEAYKMKELNGRIYVTGNPTFDVHKYNKENIKKELKIPNNTLIYLVGITVGIHEVKRFIDEIQRTELSGNEFFIFKLHPNLDDETDIINKMLKNCNLRYTLFCSNISAYKLLSIADGLITYVADTLWAESFYYDVRSILIVVPGYIIRPVNKLLYDACVLVNDLSECKSLKNTLSGIDPEKIADVKRKYFYKCDYSASKRIMSIVDELLKHDSLNWLRLENHTNDLKC